MNLANNFIRAIEASSHELSRLEMWRSEGNFFQPPAPPAIRAALEEATRKEQLLIGGGYCRLALRQIDHRQAIATYASLNYAVDGREAA